MSGNDVFLYSVPADANPNDVRLRDPSGAVPLGASVAWSDGADVLASAVGVVVGVSSATTDGADVLAAAVALVSSAVGLSAALVDGADVLTAAVDAPSAYIVTPGAKQSVFQRKRETEEEKRLRRIEQGIDQAQPLAAAIAPVAGQRQIEELIDAVAQAKAANAAAAQYIARLNAQIDAQEIARQQLVMEQAKALQNRAQQDLDDIDLAFVLAVMSEA